MDEISHATQEYKVLYMTISYQYNILHIIILPVMLVKVNNIDMDKNKVRVSKLDIDDYGSIIPLKDLELKIPANDNSIIQTLQNSSYAAIFTEGNIDDNNSTIILANGITIYELNKEKSKTIDKVANKK
jgi:hypothetical protein